MNLTLQSLIDALAKSTADDYLRNNPLPANEEMNGRSEQAPVFETEKAA